MRLRTVALALVIGLVGGCDWSGGDGRDRNPENRPGYVLGEPEGAPHRVRGDGDVTSFQLFGGADVVRVRLGDLGGDLYELSTPDDSKAAPAASIEGPDLIASLHGTGKSGPAVLTVVLSDDVRWKIKLAGGAQDQSADLSNGLGGDVDFAAGSTRAAVILPAAGGTQKVTLGGGASLLSVRVAGSAPVRVSALNGAGSVTIDGKVHTGVPGGSVWMQDGWEQAASRYDVNAASGVATVTVDRF